jgi:membrane-associated phospholipid phosphatase
MIAIVAAVTLIDCVWAAFHHFDIDRAAYARLAVLALLLWVGAVFYDRVRKAPSIAAMLSGTAFLIAFSAGFSVLNYFLLNVAHARIDTQLAAVDRAIGMDWPAMMAAFAPHPVVNGLLRVCYESVLPQVALLVIGLSWQGQLQKLHAFCVALAIGAALTVAVWTMFPSFGAFSVYSLPPAISAHLSLSLDQHYAHELVQLLANGPGRISPSEVKGLIGFPSFHAAMALLVVWYGRTLPTIRWPLVVWNALVLVATPIQGGHHVVDVLGGLVVVAISIALTARLSRDGQMQRRPYQKSNVTPVTCSP